MSQMAHPSGPPYLPTTASLGGRPTVQEDDPISAVFLFLFVVAAIVHMTIFQINRKRDHKFIFSALLFGFCMARITTLTLRIVWASRPTNVNIAIAAQIFVAAGVLLLFMVNLIFAHRILRSYHPKFGWSKPVSLIFRFCYFSVIALLIMVITCTVHAFFTLDINARRIDRDVQLFSGTYLAALAFLPVPIVLLAAWTPRNTRVEKFGQGRWRSKIWLLLTTSTLLALGAGFRIGVNFAVRPAADPAWYHSKPCFYCFNFVIEIIVVYLYAIARFDRRFHVPDGSSAPGHYSGMQQLPSFKERVNREEDVFGQDDTELNSVERGKQAKEWEARAREELAKENVSDAV